MQGSTTDPNQDANDKNTMAIKYTIQKNITANVWKWEIGVEKLFRVESAIRIGRAPKPGSTIVKAAELLDVIDLKTGKKEVLITGTVIRDNLIETYPNDGYVGKCFRAVQGPVKEGKKYKTYDLEEITVEDSPDDSVSDPTPTPAEPAPTATKRGKK